MQREAAPFFQQPGVDFSQFPSRHTDLSANPAEEPSEMPILTILRLSHHGPSRHQHLSSGLSQWLLTVPLPLPWPLSSHSAWCCLLSSQNRGIILDSPVFISLHIYLLATPVDFTFNTCPESNHPYYLHHCHPSHHHLPLSMIGDMDTTQNETHLWAAGVQGRATVLKPTHNRRAQGPLKVESSEPSLFSFSLTLETWG